MKRFLLSPIVLLLFFSGMLSMSYASGPDGVALYSANCAKCHNGLGGTTVPGRRLSRIKSAIRVNIGGMSSLRGMKDEELKAIADVLFLAGVPEDVDGMKIYGICCSSCHRDIEQSNILNKTSGDIRLAMKARKCNQDTGALLSEEDVEKVAEALKARRKGGRVP